MSDELVIRQVWPVPRGHSVLSPFEASDDFEQACWQASEVITASPSDLFYTFTRAGQEVVRLIVVDHPDLDPDYGVPDAGDGLEIDFMEVASGYRRQGLGTQAIELLRRQHPAGPCSPDRLKARTRSGSPWAGTTYAIPTTGTIPRCS